MDKISSRNGAPPATIDGGAGVTRAMVHARARELALQAGHVPPHVSQLDYEQAKRELTGESDPERQAAILDVKPGQRTGEETKPE